MEEPREEGVDMAQCAEKLSAAAEALERVLDKLEAQYRSLDAKVERIAAAVEEADAEAPAREEVAASETKAEPQRRTMSPMMATLLSKQGVELKNPMEAEALDEALRSLSVEQRIAVKMELARSGASG